MSGEDGISGFFQSGIVSGTGIVFEQLEGFNDIQQTLLDQSLNEGFQDLIGVASGILESASTPADPPFVGADGRVVRIPTPPRSGNLQTLIPYRCGDVQKTINYAKIAVGMQLCPAPPTPIRVQTAAAAVEVPMFVTGFDPNSFGLADFGATGPVVVGQDPFGGGLLGAGSVLGGQLGGLLGGVFGDTGQGIGEALGAIAGAIGGGIAQQNLVEFLTEESQQTLPVPQSGAVTAMRFPIETMVPGADEAAGALDALMRALGLGEGNATPTGPGTSTTPFDLPGGLPGTTTSCSPAALATLTAKQRSDIDTKRKFPAPAPRWGTPNIMKVRDCFGRLVSYKRCGGNALSTGCKPKAKPRPKRRTRSAFCAPSRPRRTTRRRARACATACAPKRRTVRSGISAAQRAARARFAAAARRCGGKIPRGRSLAAACK